MLAGCTKEEAIIYGLTVSGLVIRTPEVAWFYIGAFSDHPREFVTYKILRMKGDILTKGQLQLLGLRSNSKISKQFYETLSDEGLSDPLESAVTIAVSISNAVCTRHDVHRLVAAMGPNQLLRVEPSRMAAGPCAEAIRLSQSQSKASEAILFPLQGCDKRGQCACRWSLGSMCLDDMNHEPVPYRLSLE